MRRPYFHKLVLSSTIRERRLRLPDSFVRKFKDELSIAAVLIVPGGIASRVGLKRADNKIWFQDGWPEFLERFSVRVGYFLVFRYEGNSSFSVFIYNLPSSEINYQFHALSGIEMPKRVKQNHIFEEIEDDESELLNQPSINKGFNSPTNNLFGSFKHCNNLDFSGERNLHQSQGSVDFHAGNHSTRDIGVQFDTVELRNSLNAIALHSVGTDLQSLKKSGRKKLKIDPNSQPSSAQNVHDGEMRFRFYESASARKRTVTAEERERAINAAKAFEPTNPFCRVVLRPSYLYRGCIMYLPSCFAEKYLNGISGFIKLQLPDGRQWPVRCLYKGGRAKFSQGWYEFTLENNLGEGDVCIFEVLRAREFILKVTVFRILESSGYANRMTQ